MQSNTIGLGEDFVINKECLIRFFWIFPKGKFVINLSSVDFSMFCYQKLILGRIWLSYEIKADFNSNLSDLSDWSLSDDEDVGEDTRRSQANVAQSDIKALRYCKIKKYPWNLIPMMSQHNFYSSLFTKFLYD